jgi:hypothetical protein
MLVERTAKPHFEVRNKHRRALLMLLCAQLSIFADGSRQLKQLKRALLRYKRLRERGDQCGDDAACLVEAVSRIDFRREEQVRLAVPFRFFHED